MKAVIIAVLVVLIGAVGYFLMMPRTEAPETVIMEEKTKTGEMMEGKEEAMGVTDWIEAAMGGKKLECEYALGGDGSGVMKVQIDGKKYRSEFEMQGTRMISVLDGETIWNWDPVKKEGFKMDMKCLEEFQKNLPQGATEQNEYHKSSEELIKETPNISCKESGSVDLSIPADVKFVDQCESFKETTKMMEQYKSQMPADAQKMMEQFGQ